MNYRYRNNYSFDYPENSKMYEEEYDRSIDFVRKEGELIIEKNTVYEIDTDCFECIKNIAEMKANGGLN